MTDRVGSQVMHSGVVKNGTAILSEQLVVRQPKIFSLPMLIVLYNHLKYIIFSSSLYYVLPDL